MAWKVLSQNIISTKEELSKQLLLNRGLKTKQEIEKFLNPNLADFEKEFDLEGIDIAKKRILDAIKKEELIVVYGDYDVDGVCSSAILYHSLTAKGAKVLPYIPHREKEGYGISKFGLDQVKDKGAKLIITVDNGIVALNEAEYAASLGLDLIITDHHTPLPEKPKALAIIHSVKMCGAGVAWCLAKSLTTKEEALDLLDLVAIASVCDLVPLLDINRSLVKEGLLKLNTTKRIGILALIMECNLELGNLGTYHIGHIIGPRLNAIGRLEHAVDALRLLCTKDANKAYSLAKLLCNANDQKKQITTQAILEAKEDILKISAGGKLEKKVLILHSPNWIPGVIGLMAGRICEEYNLPTVIISKGETYSKGSVRGNNGLNIVETIRLCSDLLIDVGGHPKAAGFTIETTKISQFEEKLSQVIEGLTEKVEDSYLEVEALVDPQKLDKSWVEEMKQFEPFGIGNLRPTLACKAVKVSDVRTVGSGQHLKFKTEGIDSIAFSMGDLQNFLSEGQAINLAYYLEIDNYMGADKLQFKVVDIQLN